MGKRRQSKEITTFPDGQPFCPVHNFKLYKAIRASTELPPGAKVIWEALVEKTYKPHTWVDYSYNALALDTGLKRDQAKRYVKILVRAGMLSLTPRFKDGHQKANHIEFLWRSPELIRQLGFRSRKRGGVRLHVAANCQA